MTILNLFLTFLYIGTVSFGGGYGMISVIRDAVLANGWLSEEQLLSFIAVAESTPGPIAINTATFIGSELFGVFGAVVATAGVVIPAFTIILIIASLISNFLKYAGVKAFLSGVRPTVVALILATAVTMGLKTLFSVSNVYSFAPSVDLRGIMILALLFGISFVYKKFKKKKPSPIVMILISAVLGIGLYSI